MSILSPTPVFRRAAGHDLTSCPLAREVANRVPMQARDIDKILHAAEIDVETANPERVAAIFDVVLTEMRKRSPKLS